MPVPTNYLVDKTLAEFHLFPKLPKELRLDIWGLAIQPRIIEVIFIGGDFPDDDDDYNHHKYASTLPSLLDVHRESRAEGLLYYELSQQSDKFALNQFYFNPNIDILDLCGVEDKQKWYSFLHRDECGLLNNIRKIAIPKTLFVDSGFNMNAMTVSQEIAMAFARYCASDKTVVKAPIEKFPAVKEAIIVMADPCLMPGETHEDCACLTKTLSEFEELPEALKGERENVGCWTPEYIAQVPAPRNPAAEFFEPLWTSNTSIPCPVVRCVAICERSRSRHTLGAEEVARFLAAKTSRDGEKSRHNPQVPLQIS